MRIISDKMYKVYLTCSKTIYIFVITPLFAGIFFPLILAAPFLLYSVHIVYLLFFSCFRECILRVERSSLKCLLFPMSFPKMFLSSKFSMLYYFSAPILFQNFAYIFVFSFFVSEWPQIFLVYYLLQSSVDGIHFFCIMVNQDIPMVKYCWFVLLV